MVVVVLFVAALTTPIAAIAGLVTALSATVSISATGDILYRYDLSNSMNSTLAAIAFRIDVAPESNLTTVYAPVGWDVSYANGQTLVSWESSSPLSDILPGTSGMFGFTSTLGPLDQGYAVLGFDDFSGNTEFNFGRTPAPGMIPEPSTTLVLSLMIHSVVRVRFTSTRARPA